MRLDTKSRLLFSLGLLALLVMVEEQTHRAAGVSDVKMVWMGGLASLIGLAAWVASGGPLSRVGAALAGR